jgi:hypothetical protein
VRVCEHVDIVDEIKVHIPLVSDRLATLIVKFWNVDLYIYEINFRLLGL